MNASYSDVEEALLSSADSQNQPDPDGRGRRPEAEPEERADRRSLKDDPEKVLLRMRRARRTRWLWT